jgi:hypothetical protein
MSRVRAAVLRLLPAFLVAAGVGLSAAGCGTDLLPPDVPGTGRVCYQDSDCVPDGCCGQASDAVHIEDAPDCSQVTCDGSCPENQIDCGCGLPVCSDSHCTVAYTTGPGCPTVRAPGALFR